MAFARSGDALVCNRFPRVVNRDHLGRSADSPRVALDHTSPATGQSWGQLETLYCCNTCGTSNPQCGSPELLTSVSFLACLAGCHGLPYRTELGMGALGRFSLPNSPEKH